MAKLFESDGVLARGVPGTLMTETKSSGRVSVSAQFKINAGQKANDDQGREVSVAGTTLTWFSTVSEKTRQRTIESIAMSGLSPEAAERIIELAESGRCGKVPEKYGFGSRDVSLACSIQTYEGKTNTRIAWVNSAAGRKSRTADLEELDLGDVPLASSASENSGAVRDNDDPFA